MRWFGNDDNGFTAKDFTIVASLFTTFGLVIVGAYSELFLGGVTENYIELIKIVVPVAATSVAGVFGVEAVQTYKNKNKPKGSAENESYK